MANPNPAANGISTRYSANQGYELSSKVTGCKLPVGLTQWLNGLSNKAGWIRAVLLAAAHAQRSGKDPIELLVGVDASEALPDIDL
ncbi:MAG: hypothetical protein F6K11_00860 [Leptolyngbya sp. SIO3F4]|nr:hypothetical protein [Leptolyngbya sp. SIO3F4]